MQEILDKLISTYGDKFLICDCNHPMITHGSLADEAKLYNLTETEISEVVSKFVSLSGKDINQTQPVDSLSGGQKVILLVLLALASRAESILYFDLERSLDAERKHLVQDLLDKHRTHRNILVLDALE